MSQKQTMVGIAAVVAIGLACWTFMRPDQQPRSEPLNPEQSHPPTSQDEDPAPLDDLGAGSVHRQQEPVEVTEAPAPEVSGRAVDWSDTTDRYPLPWGDDFGERPTRPQYVLEEMYEDHDMDQLEAAYDILHPQMTGYMNEELFRLLDSPDCTAFDLDYTLDENGTKKYIGLNITLVGNHPFYGSRSGTHPDGSPFAKFAWLPYDEHEDFYKQTQEVYYVMNLFYKLQDEMYLAAGGIEGNFVARSLGN